MGQGGKLKDHSVDIVNEKNLLTWTKDKERKTEINGERRGLLRRDLDDKGLSQNSDSSMSPRLCRLVFVASSLSPHLTCFLAHLVGRLCFCLRGSVGLVVGLAIGSAVLIAGEVAVGLSGWSLWNKLMSFLRCWTVEVGSQVFSSFGYLFHETR